MEVNFLSISERLRPLDGVRGLAAIVIAFFLHWHDNMNRDFTLLSYGYLDGRVFVELFFMIYSGDKIEIDAIEYAINPYKKILGNKWKCILCVYLLLIEIGGTQGISKLSVYLTNYLTKLIS